MMLENLEPAKPVKQSKEVKPSLQFDGTEGEAVTQGYSSEPENFDEFLRDAGMDPKDIEVIPPVRTSRWQRWDGDWLTSYRFTFRKKSSSIDLPLLFAESKKKINKPKLANPNDRALVILWSDLQVGKVDYRGGTEQLLERVALMQARLMEQVKREKPEKVIFADLGDTVENFYNAATPHQQALQQRLEHHGAGRCCDNAGMANPAKNCRTSTRSNIRLGSLQPLPVQGSQR
jgi:hypothetical protein